MPPVVLICIVLVCIALLLGGVSVQLTLSAAVLAVIAHMLATPQKSKSSRDDSVSGNFTADTHAPYPAYPARARTRAISLFQNQPTSPSVREIAPWSEQGLANAYTQRTITGGTSQTDKATIQRNIGYGRYKDIYEHHPKFNYIATRFYEHHVDNPPTGVPEVKLTETYIVCANNWPAAANMWLKVSDNASGLYHDSTWQTLLTRLITRPSLMFDGKDDYHITTRRGHNKPPIQPILCQRILQADNTYPFNTGNPLTLYPFGLIHSWLDQPTYINWQPARNDDPNYPSIDDTLSYNEMHLAAFLGISAHTRFYGTGTFSGNPKCKCSDPPDKKAPCMHEKDGILVGLIGERFESADSMGYQTICTNDHLNKLPIAAAIINYIDNTSDDLPATKLYYGCNYYKNPLNTTLRQTINGTRFIRRLMIPVRLLLDDVVRRIGYGGTQNNRTPYVVATGLGCGRWAHPSLTHNETDLINLYAWISCLFDEKYDNIPLIEYRHCGITQNIYSKLKEAIAEIMGKSNPVRTAEHTRKIEHPHPVHTSNTKVYIWKIHTSLTVTAKVRYFMYREYKETAADKWGFAQSVEQIKKHITDRSKPALHTTYDAELECYTALSKSSNIPLLISMFPRGPNSYVGNDFWNTTNTTTNSSVVATLCSDIAIVMNPDINPNALWFGAVNNTHRDIPNPFKYKPMALHKPDPNTPIPDEPSVRDWAYLRHMRKNVRVYNEAIARWKKYGEDDRKKYMQNTYIIHPTNDGHEMFIDVLNEFLEIKRKSGYTVYDGYDADKLLTRLICDRSLVFYCRNDTHLTYDDMSPNSELAYVAGQNVKYSNMQDTINQHFKECMPDMTAHTIKDTIPAELKDRINAYVDDPAYIEFKKTDCTPNYLKWENTLSYDEMLLSSLIGVSAHTKFINKGGRNNKGEEDHTDTYEQEGILMGLVGARCEAPGIMDYLTLCSPGKRGSDIYDGKTVIKRIQNYIYAFKFSTYQYLDTLYWYLREKEPNTGQFDFVMFVKRLAIPAKMMLDDTVRRTATAEFQTTGKKAYVVANGLGDGEWKPAEVNWGVVTFINVCAWLGMVFDKKYDSIPVIEYRHFNKYPSIYQMIMDIMTDVISQEKQNDCTITPVVTTDKVLVYSIKRADNPNTRYFIYRYSDFSPGELVSNLYALQDGSKICYKAYLHETKWIALLITMFAWDGASYPGNEYWLEQYWLSGDPAAACCSDIAISMNPIHNKKYLRANYANGKKGDADAARYRQEQYNIDTNTTAEPAKPVPKTHLELAVTTTHSTHSTHPSPHPAPHPPAHPPHPTATHTTPAAPKPHAPHSAPAPTAAPKAPATPPTPTTSATLAPHSAHAAHLTHTTPNAHATDPNEHHKHSGPVNKGEETAYVLKVSALVDEVSKSIDTYVKLADSMCPTNMPDAEKAVNEHIANYKKAIQDKTYIQLTQHPEYGNYRTKFNDLKQDYKTLVDKFKKKQKEVKAGKCCLIL